MRFLAALALLCAAACGPVESTAVILDADVELDAARKAQAEVYDPYNFTGAEAYLWKARELQGYSEYEKAIEFGDKAMKMAKKAKEHALEAKRAEEAPQP